MRSTFTEEITRSAIILCVCVLFMTKRNRQLSRQLFIVTVMGHAPVKEVTAVVLLDGFVQINQDGT